MVNGREAAARRVAGPLRMERALSLLPLCAVSLLSLCPSAEAADSPAPALVLIPAPTPADWSADSLSFSVGGVRVSADGRWTAIPTTGGWQSLQLGPAPGGDGAVAWLLPVAGERYRGSLTPCTGYTITPADRPSAAGRVRIDLRGADPMELVYDMGRAPLRPKLNAWIDLDQPACGGPRSFRVVRPGAEAWDSTAFGCTVSIVFLNGEDATVVCDPRTHEVSLR